MTAFESGTSRHECLQTDLPENSSQPPLFRLPCELRQMIYRWSIEFSRSPDPHLVHETNLRATWKDCPSPLLSTCKQTRDDIKDLLQNHRQFTLRVTTFGVAFDMLSLSCFIAQGFMTRGKPKSYIGLSGLQIEIWPPHSHYSRRKIEMLYLYEHLQTLRHSLCAGPQISQLSVCFQESPPVTWSEGGKPRRTLADHDWSERNDMELVMDHFAYITNVDKASVQLPPTLQSNETLVFHAEVVAERMEIGFLDEDYDIYDDVTDAVLENPFEYGIPNLKELFLDPIIMYRNDLEEIDYAWMYSAWYDKDYVNWRTDTGHFRRQTDYDSD